MLGAFIASGILHFSYKVGLNTSEALNATNSACLDSSPVLSSASCFSTFPHPTVAEQPIVCMFDQILGTAILLFLINAVTDRKSDMKVSPSFVPVIVGILVLVIGQTFGVNYAYAINPARDLGPRIYMAIFGWENVFGCRPGYFMIPIFGPIIGAVLGTLLYRKTIGNFGNGVEKKSKESDVFIN